MPRSVGFVLLLIARVAAADDHDYSLVDDTLEQVTAADERGVALTTALSSQATAGSSSAQGAGIASARAEANVVEIMGTREGYRLALGGEAELRGGFGDVPARAGRWIARGALEDTPLFDGGPHFGVATATVEVERDYDTLPSLRDARELLRAPYDRTRYDVHFTFSRYREESSYWSGMTLPLRVVSERTLQHNGDIAYTSQVMEIEMGVYRLCYGLDSDLFCVRIIEGGATSPVGARRSTSHWYPLGVDGVPLGEHARADARVGVLFGNYRLSNAPFGLEEMNQHPGATCESLGICVTMKTVGYDLTVRSVSAPHQLHASRRAYNAYGGEVAIEDRGELATSWQLPRMTLAASAYAAHTRWWAIVDDRFSRQHRGITYGVDVSASRALGKRWRVDGTVSAGRSWYGALDGEAPRAGFAAQGMVALAHELRSHWWSLQRLRPAPEPPF
jgi:hypothetical protein